MVQRNTPDFSLDKIFGKLEKKLPHADKQSMQELWSKVSDEGVTNDRLLTEVLLDLLSSNELSAGTKPLIL